MKLIEKIEKIILQRTAVLYLKGLPGIGKSSIIKAIAKKNGWDFVDIRLSQRDSVEVIGLPYRKETEDGIDVMHYAIPNWAYKANKKPTLVFFDELNRATLETQNAALQILLDKQIGEEFIFNENVYFAAAGNLGEEDGCEVNEFDKALKGRLAILEYNPSIEEWVEEFGNENVNKYICSFLLNNPTFFHKMENNYDSYCSPRSWTFLSGFIGKENKNINEIKRIINEFGKYYIGPGVTRFLRYINDIECVSINDILENYNEAIKKVTIRHRMNELLKELEAINIDILGKSEFENYLKFLLHIDADERIGYFSFVVNKFLHKKNKSEKTTSSENVKKLIEIFKDEFHKIFIENA